MATLQAARAFVLGLSLEMAESWGLNRAIFYAAAKRGFKEKPPPTIPRTWEMIERAPIHETRDVYFLGDEMAYKATEGNKTCFTIGGELQTEESFKAQIENRFGEKFNQAWEEALRIVKSFDRRVLLSQKAFYEDVYRPRRDELAAKWTEIAASGKG
jgi:hypothetical protein